MIGTQPAVHANLTSYLTLEHIKAWMPLIVVLLTVLLSGYIIPKTTQKVQDQRKELEIKTSLVETINSSVMNILLAVQLAERKAIPQEEFDKEYRAWEIERAVILGRLTAYFPASDVPIAFRNLAEGITDIYVLTGISNPAYRSRHISKMKAYFGDGATDWSKLEDLALRSSNFFDWFFGWWNLREEAVVRKDAVVRQVLSSELNLGS